MTDENYIPAVPLVPAAGHHARRDLFAAAALQGQVAYDSATTPEMVAVLCRRYADALIKELDKPKEAKA